MHKDNTPIYNVNRQVVNFKDFHPEEEKPELNKIKKSYKKTDLDVHRKERKYKFNNITRKLDDLDKSEVEDKLEVLEEGVQSLQPMDNPDVEIRHICDKINEIIKELNSIRSQIGPSRASLGPRKRY